MLRDHRRAMLYALVMLLAVAAVFVAVGRRSPDLAPRTTVAFVGTWDQSVHDWAVDVRNDPATLLARFLSVVGGGLVTIPLRIAVGAWLAFRTRWRALVVWLGTWAVAEIVLSSAKAFFHRGRPPSPLVDVVNFSFPSGHAVAASATAVALVLVLMPSGPERRRWEWTAAGFAFVMALSRVYLGAHWLSDVVAGVLLGSGTALAVAGVTTEVRDRLLHRGHHATTPAAATPGT